MQRWESMTPAIHNVVETHTWSPDWKRVFTLSLSLSVLLVCELSWICSPQAEKEYEDGFLQRGSHRRPFVQLQICPEWSCPVSWKPVHLGRDPTPGFKPQTNRRRRPGTHFSCFFFCASISPKPSTRKENGHHNSPAVAPPLLEKKKDHMEKKK